MAACEKHGGPFSPHDRLQLFATMQRLLQLLPPEIRHDGDHASAVALIALALSFDKNCDGRGEVSDFDKWLYVKYQESLTNPQGQFYKDLSKQAGVAKAISNGQGQGAGAESVRA